MANKRELREVSRLLESNAQTIREITASLRWVRAVISEKTHNEIKLQREVARLRSVILNSRTIEEARGRL